MSAYKASIYNYVFNSINTIIVIVNGIVMVPIYFHYMSVSTYGAWLATGNMVGMIGLLESGFASVITQKMASAIGSHNDKAYQILAGSNILTALFISIAMFLLGLIISPFITNWINVEPFVESQIQQAYFIALASSCIAICVSLFGAYPQVWQDTKTVGIINTCTGILSIAILVICLCSGLGVISIPISYLVRSSSNLFLQGLWILRKRKRDHILPPIFLIRESIVLTKDCVYPFLSKIAGFLMGNSQSFIIAHFMSPAYAAIYDITQKVCFVACTFVAQTNGSFFALFSLTLSSGDQQRIDGVFRNTSRFFSISIASVALYSMCFSESIINYWVGLDKFGGTWLLLLIVASTVFIQLRSYCNNILYTGGMINKSAKFDMLCAVVYIALLLAIIKPLQIYAIPLSIFIVSATFIVLYLRLMKREIHLDVRQLSMDFFKSILVILPFLIIHVILKFDYQNILLYIVYVFVFTSLYLTVLYLSNKKFFLQFATKITRK